MSPPRGEPRLVVITGPVGGGKSTAAQALAMRLRRERESKVAVLDLDVVYCMLRQHNGFGELELWPVARTASGALAGSLFAQGFDVVVVEGEYFTPAHFAQIRQGASALPSFVAFALYVTYPKALRRVGLDPTRGASKDPELLAQMHAAFLAAQPFLRHATLLLDGDRRDPEQLAADMAAALERPAEKVLVYITYEGRLLVLEEPDFPGAGVQVPGGTLEPGEDPAQGALREAFEETGLAGLTLLRSLGVQLYAAKDGRALRRHYFQLAPSAPPPLEWEHWEQSPSTGEPPIRLRLRWVSLDAVPPLADGRDALLGELER